MEKLRFYQALGCHVDRTKTLTLKKPEKVCQKAHLLFLHKNNMSILPACVPSARIHNKCQIPKLNIHMLDRTKIIYDQSLHEQYETS